MVVYINIKRNYLMTNTILVSRDHGIRKEPVTLVCLKNKHMRLDLKKNSFIFSVEQLRKPKNSINLRPVYFIK